MSLLDGLVSVLAPHDCLGCGQEGALLCPDCVSSLDKLPERCYHCRKVTPDSITCQACRKASRLYRVQAATIYKDKAKDLVWQLKFAGAQAAAQLMAQQMTPLLKLNQTRPLIVPVPTATSRIRQRGYDQASLIAKELARHARLPYYACLARHGQAHQHQASRRERLVQLTTAFRVSRSLQIPGANIILVDDVVTTGATLEAAAAVLKAAGAKQIEAVVFAQP